MMWIDLYEQMVEVQNTSLVTIDEFELWSRRSYQLEIGDREGSKVSE